MSKKHKFDETSGGFESQETADPVATEPVYNGLTKDAIKMLDDERAELAAKAEAALEKLEAKAADVTESRPTED